MEIKMVRTMRLISLFSGAGGLDFSTYEGFNEF